MTGTRTKVMRLVVAALLVLPAIVASVSPSLAAPSQQDVEDAKAKLAQLQEQFASLNEQWNEARYQLQQAQEHLAEAKAMKESAEADAAEARGRLAERAVQAYTDMGSQYEALLSVELDDGVLRSPRVPGRDHPDRLRSRRARPTRPHSAPRGRPRSTTTPSPTPRPRPTR